MQALFEPRALRVLILRLVRAALAHERMTPERIARLQDKLRCAAVLGF